MNLAGKFHTTLALAALLAAATISMPLSVYANVCSEGTGLPPFLSAGTDPNLLLVLDNSGSMLELAYVESVDECVDNSFDPTASYAGLFDSARWYWWRDGSTPWKSGNTYAVGDYVYTEGVFSGLLLPQGIHPVVKELILTLKCRGHE